MRDWERRCARNETRRLLQLSKTDGILSQLVYIQYSYIHFGAERGGGERRKHRSRKCETKLQRVWTVEIVFYDLTE